MKIKLLTLLLISIITIGRLQSQNLIPNNGFEKLDKNGKIENWVEIIYNNPKVFKEDSIIKAFKGNQSVGVFLSDLSTKIEDNRTFYQIKLTKSLKKNKKYRFNMYCKLSEFSSHSTKSFGVNFSPNEIKPYELKQYFNNKPNLLFNQRVGTTYWNSEYLKSSSDLKRWTDNNTVVIDVIYTAKGNEKYLTIGNFYDYKSTFIYHIFNYGYDENTYIYYLIDELSLTEL